MQPAKILGLLLVAACITHGQALDVVDVVEKQGLTTFASLLRKIGAYDGLNNPNFVGTVLAPSNAAIATFLSKMGLTAEEALKRPDFIDAVLGYHVIPYKKGLTSEIPKGSYRAAGTADPNEPVYIFKKADGSIVVQDMQGNNVKATRTDLDAGKAAVYIIDQVLMSEKYYFTIADALLSPIDVEWDTLATAAKVLPGPLQSAFKDPKTEITLFGPSNQAFRKIPGALSLPKEQLINILSYHAVAGYRENPDGFKNGEKLETLYKGHSLGVKVDSDASGAITSLIPEKGGAVPIVQSNTWAGKSIIQGIDSVLLPASAPATKTATTGRKLLQSRLYRSDFNTWNRDTVRQPTATQRTQASIRAAASGQAPASYATSTGSWAAQSTTTRGNCWNC